MSLIGPLTPAIDDAIRLAVSNNIVVVTAAGKIELFTTYYHNFIPLESFLNKNINPIFVIVIIFLKINLCELCQQKQQAKCQHAVQHTC